MKTGTEFDTKKSAGEIKTLIDVKNILKLEGFDVESPLIICYEARTTKDINLKTELYGCKPGTFENFLSLILNKEMIEIGKNKVKEMFMLEANKNLYTFVQKVDPIVKTEYFQKEYFQKI